MDEYSRFEIETRTLIDVIDQKMTRRMKDLNLDEFEDFRDDLAMWTWTKTAMEHIVEMDKRISEMYYDMKKRK